MQQTAAIQRVRRSRPVTTPRMLTRPGSITNGGPAQRGACNVIGSGTGQATMAGNSASERIVASGLPGKRSARCP
jgi:hypothetical protein